MGRFSVLIILIVFLLPPAYPGYTPGSQEKQYTYPPEFPSLTASEAVELIRKDQYTERFLPKIRSGDIAILLKYADDTTQIKNFAMNPLSSFLPESVSRGELLLWMVEAWRVHPGETNPMAYFPSGVALLKPFDSQSPPYNSGQKIREAASLYRTWWTNYSSDTTKARLLDPLQGSGIRW